MSLRYTPEQILKATEELHGSQCVPDRRHANMLRQLVEQLAESRDALEVANVSWARAEKNVILYQSRVIDRNHTIEKMKVELKDVHGVNNERGHIICELRAAQNKVPDFRAIPGDDFIVTIKLTHERIVK